MNSILFTKHNKIKKIMKIQDIRLAKAGKLLAEAHREYLEARNTMEQRNNIMDSLYLQKKELKAYIIKMHSTCAYSSESKLREADAKYWIEYDLEMHEYYLDQDKTNLEQKRKVYNEKKKIWFRQKLKMESIHNLYIKTKIQSDKIRNENEEDEIQEESNYENGILIC
jgi:phage FluMu protein Com